MDTSYNNAVEIEEANGHTVCELRLFAKELEQSAIANSLQPINAQFQRQEIECCQGAWFTLMHLQRFCKQTNPEWNVHMSSNSVTVLMVCLSDMHADGQYTTNRQPISVHIT
jgi:hypothetical protein